MNQEIIALIIVAIAAIVTGLKVFRSTVATPLAKWLLKRGQVKWAMRVNSQAKAPGCSDCH